MPTEVKRFAPAADRNREAIAGILQRVLPSEGRVLEVASGTGQHVSFFAEKFPSLQWQPSDVDSEALASIDAWRRSAELRNLLAPVKLDVREPWPILSADAVLAINLVHISPWDATEALVEHSHGVLVDGGALFFYGPYFAEDVETAPSNLEFDASLRARDTAWGIRSFEKVRSLAEARGFFFQDRFVMPANNFCLVFRKRPQSWGIREDQPRDSEVLGDLLVASFRDTYAVKMPEVVMTPRRERELRDLAAKAGKGTTWVAEVAGRVVGTVFVVRPGQKDSLAWHSEFAELKHLAVSPQYRRSGLSEALMEAAYAGMRSWGAAGVCLHVRRGAAGVARFYEKQGFVRAPEGDFDRLPEVFLQAYYKSLSGGQG